MKKKALISTLKIEHETHVLTCKKDKLCWPPFMVTQVITFIQPKYALYLPKLESLQSLYWYNFYLAEINLRKLFINWKIEINIPTQCLCWLGHPQWQQNVHMSYLSKIYQTIKTSNKLLLSFWVAQMEIHCKESLITSFGIQIYN